MSANGKADARTFGQDLMRGEHRVANDNAGKPVERLEAPRLSMDLLDFCGCARPASNDNSLRGRYMAPPFSVLNTQTGEWQDRKREWLALGIKSEVGRGASSMAGQNGAGGAHAIPGGGTGKNSAWLFKTGEKYEAVYKQGDLTNTTTASGNAMAMAGGFEDKSTGAAGTSIFDPVLTEICLSWFCPGGGLVLDPFAGGSVRGIVAGKMGLQYQGHELRAEQVSANVEQADRLCPGGPVRWVTGDSAATIPAQDVAADMVFSCPPYGNLEVYSDDPADISNMPFERFAVRYSEIIAAACAKLRPNRFAAFVVGNYRDTKRGTYHDLVGLTVRAFQSAGLGFYNDIVLLNAIGSAAVRGGRQFAGSRKVVKVHQNVLVFVKGDWKAATKAVAGA